MQDLISKIVEMDEKAQELTAEAQRKKADSEQEIAKAKDSIYNDYIARARKHIADIEKVESNTAETHWQEAKAKQDIVLKKLNENYLANGDSWVTSIVSRVISN